MSGLFRSTKRCANTQYDHERTIADLLSANPRADGPNENSIVSWNDKWSLKHRTTGKIIQLVNHSQTIGRSGDIIVSDDLKSVSRVHASVQTYPEYIDITDNNSKYGTYINEQRIPRNETMTIQQGVSVRFGMTDCIWTLESAEPAPAKRKKVSSAVDRALILAYDGEKRLTRSGVQMNETHAGTGSEPLSIERNKENQPPRSKRQTQNIRHISLQLNSAKWKMRHLEKLAKFVHRPSAVGRQSKAHYVNALLKVPVPVHQYTVNEIMTFFDRAHIKRPARDNKEILTAKINKFLRSFKNIKREGFTSENDWLQYVTRCAEKVYTLEQSAEIHHIPSIGGNCN